MTRVIKSSQPLPSNVLSLTGFAQQARDVVLEARKEAARIIADAKSIAESSRREASEQGYNEGFTRGKEHGYLDGKHKAIEQAKVQCREQSAELAHLARRTLREATQAHEDVLQETASEVLSLAMKLAEKIVQKVAGADISAAQSNLVKALQLAGTAGEVTVHVNPSQHQQLCEFFSQYMQEMDNRGRIVPDPEISPGGVKAVTSRGQIDATIESQLENVARALLSRQSEGDYRAEPTVTKHLREQDPLALAEMNYVRS